MTDNPQTGPVPEVPDQSVDGRVVIVTGQGLVVDGGMVHR